jgi:hypothetical protein
MQEYRIKRTKEGYDLGYKDIVGLANSFKEFIQQNKYDLRYCNFRGADFRGADLSGADLSGVDLSGVDLRYCNFRNAKIYRYRFLKTDDIFKECFLGIGCKTRKIKNWNTFFYNSDETLETKRNTDKFIEITKEYEETINTFKQKFDKGEIE